MKEQPFINEINDCSLLPNFESAILPAICVLCIDISDPYTKMTIREMLSSNNGDNENDLVDMTIEHLKLVTLSLKRQNNIHRPVLLKHLSTIASQNFYQKMTVPVNPCYSIQFFACLQSLHLLKYKKSS